MKLSLLAAFVLSVCLMSCGEVFGDRVKGNGNIKSETRETSAFTKVDVSGSIDLYIRQDSVRSIKVEADENLLDHIEVTTQGETLVIRPERGFNLKPTGNIKVYVSSPVFERLEASGACDIFSENKITSSEEIHIDLSGSCEVTLDLNAPKVTADLSGASDVNLRGETKELVVDGSGSSGIRCFELMAENVQIEISGAGNAEVFASVKLDVNVSGAADVKYKGNAEVSQRISGAGSVKKVE